MSCKGNALGWGHGQKECLSIFRLFYAGLSSSSLISLLRSVLFWGAFLGGGGGGGGGNSTSDKEGLLSTSSSN
ncbi:UNVERIFIED_CONTAM: hypothetical protein Sradi_1817200 [Sesamum radiatum]|uniref:Uncharacterized protein n=1 Tax=Sesamum radiatum TaxID=300843 RepID=A0AAW2TX71_SESRA